MNENRSTPIDTAVSPVGLDSSPLRGNMAGVVAESKLQKLQAVFDKSFRSITEPVKHDQVSVLLLSWERKGSDMDVSEELDGLTRVFEDGYGFSVQRKHLEESRRARLQLNALLTDFAYENEGPHNLLIVYYAGHGYSGENPGELNLTNNSSQASRHADRRKLNSVAWHSTEQFFKNIEADVLVIFDCCEAGTLRTNSRAALNHSFEFLGACDHDQRTPGPGQNSFTSALIWALSQLKDAPGFDSAELREKITTAPHADERQTPVLFPREHQTMDHVWISPRKSNDTANPASPNTLAAASAPYRDERPMEFLDMQFRFSKTQTERQVTLFAEALSLFARDQGSNLGIRQVELVQHTGIFKSVALMFCKQKKESGDESEEVAVEPPPQRLGGGQVPLGSGEEAGRTRVENVNLGLVQVNAMGGGSQLMSLERLRTFAFGVMCTLVLSRVSFAPFVEMLKSGAGWSGWVLSCGRDLCMSHGDGVHC